MNVTNTDLKTPAPAFFWTIDGTKRQKQVLKFKNYKSFVYNYFLFVKKWRYFFNGRGNRESPNMDVVV
jgi:hypothetical protein